MRNAHFRDQVGGLPQGLFILCAVFAFLCWYVFSPVFGAGFSEIPGDLGDARLNNYILEHGYKYLTGQAPSFWSAGFYYPHTGVIAHSDNLLGALVFYVPFRHLGFDRETAFQGWIITGYALNFASMAFVLLRARVSPWAAAVGATVFAFSPLQTLHLNHAQLLFRAPAPLAWHFLTGFLDRPRAGNLAAGLAFLVWQIYISLYLGYFLVLVLTAAVVSSLLSRDGLYSYVRSAPLKQKLGHVALLAGAVLALAPLWHRYSSPKIYKNTLAEVLDLLPRPAGYLIGSRNRLMEQVLGADLTIQSQYPWEHALYVGIVPWVAMLLLTPRVLRHPSGTYGGARRTVLAFWLVFTLTLSVHGVSLYRFIVEAVPPLTGIRGVTRVALMLLMPLSYAVGYEFDALLRNVSKTASGACMGIAALLFGTVAVWDTGVRCVTVGKAHVQERVAKIRQSAAVSSPASVLTWDGPILAVFRTNPSEPGYLTHMDAMIAAQELNLVTVNGSSRFAPPGFRQFSDCEGLAAMLRDYEKTVPGFSSRETVKRMVFVPSSTACGGEF